MKTLQKIKENETDIAIDFIRDGYVITDISQHKNFKNIQDAILKEINVALGDEKVKSLEESHKHIPYEKINDVRLHVYNALNRRNNFTEEYFSMHEESLSILLGTELACQNKVNLSIQMPNDKTSQLALHTDTISGQSQFEIVAWTPFTRAFGTNSMYMYSQKDSQDMMMALPKYQTKGMDALQEDWKDKSFIFDVKPGQAIIFSSTLMHGNVVNTTDITRFSLNMRFKALFSPYNNLPSSEKKIGNFYRPLRMSPVTKLALNTEEPHGQFKAN